MAQDALPLPPPGLASRVGAVEGADPLQAYLDIGQVMHDLIKSLLPDDWTWEGKRVLDFGCGSARVLRHFAEEAEHCELSGCDIDQASIEWNQANLSPPFRFFLNGLEPPLLQPDHSLDLIWATSVFTHIPDLWSAWLAELHRVLVPGGILIASFLGEGMWDALVGEPYREDEVGMSVMRRWEGPDCVVFHSEWWLREHWGRAFDVLEVRRPPRTADGSAEVTHSFIVLRARDVPVTKEELERRDPSEPRELVGLQTSLRLAQNEIILLAAKTTQTTLAYQLARRLRHLAGRALGR